MSSSPKPFTAVILAADRTSNDPVARTARVTCKALAPVAGRPMVLRVLDALADSAEVGDRILVGPERPSVERNVELNQLIKTEDVAWLSPLATPSTSAFTALQSLPDDIPVLLTTADHALLTAAMVDHFCAQARQSGCDVLAGVVREGVIRATFPETRRTITRLNDGGYSGCNLFAFLTPRARLAADFWRKVEQERKNPLRIVKVIGWTTVLRYLLGLLSLEQALSGLSKKMGLKVGVVQMPFAEAAIDVDKAEDWHLVELILSGRRERETP